MKNLKLMLKLIGKFKLTLALTCMLGAIALSAQSFDRNLEELGKLYQAKKYAEIIKKNI